MQTFGGLFVDYGSWASNTLLTLVTCVLLVWIGYSQNERERARGNAALAVCMLGWSINQFVASGEEASLINLAVAHLLYSITFFLIAIHRYRIYKPDGKAARFAAMFPFVPKLPDAE